MAKSKQRTQSAQEKSLRKYFRSSARSRTRLVFAVAALLLAVLLGVIAVSEAGTDQNTAIETGAAAAVVGLIGVVLLLFRRRQGSSVSDSMVDQWFDQGLERIKAQSLGKLGLVTRDLVGDETLVITAPILWTTSGISDEDLVSKVGEDSVIRFGVYRVTIIHLTQHHLDTYGCDYNFLKDAALNEETGEYPYRHVVSVATRDYQSNYTLPSGESFTYAQVFSLNVASGQSVNVVIGADKLNEIKGTNSLPETGADKAIAAIRKMMREISAAGSNISVPPPPMVAPLPGPQPVGPIAPTMKMTPGQGLCLVDRRTRQKYPLGQATTTIGRAPDNNIVLSDPMVSGYHAVVQLESGGYIIYDQNSSNGTFFDGHRVTGAYKLLPGKIVRLGDSEFEVTTA